MMKASQSVRPTRALALFALAGMLLVLAAGCGGSDDQTTGAGAEWSTNGGATWNQRYSTLTDIDSSNVGQLKGVWRAHLNGSGVAAKYSGESQPVVQDGV